MPDIICAGQAVLDCITRGREDAPCRPNVYRASSIRLHTGGDAVNEASHLSALGRSAAIVCALGTDLAGALLLSELRRRGVDVSRVRRLDIDTPIANLQVAGDGSRFSVNSDATRLPGYAIDPEELAGAKIVSFASLFRPPLEDAAKVVQLIRAAKAQGALVCADTKLPLRAGVGPDGIAAALPLIDYLFPNEQEAAYFTGRDRAEDMAAAFRDRGVGCVVIKRGAQGVYVSGLEGDFALPADPVPRVVDTTGAGDAFAAGFLSALLDGRGVKDCARAGLTLAAKQISGTDERKHT